MGYVVFFVEGVLVLVGCFVCLTGFLLGVEGVCFYFQVSQVSELASISLDILIIALELPIPLLPFSSINLPQNSLNNLLITMQILPTSSNLKPLPLPSPPLRPIAPLINILIDLKRKLLLIIPQLIKIEIMRRQIGWVRDLITVRFREIGLRVELAHPGVEDYLFYAGIGAEPVALVF